MKYIIYGLYDPNTNELRYIGKSKNGLNRAKDHVHPSHYNDTKKRHIPIYCWIRKLIKNEQKPIIAILCECNENDLNAKEVELIAHFKESRCRLLNVTEGGDGSKGISRKHTPEELKKMSESQMGNKNHRFGKKLTPKEKEARKDAYVNTGLKHRKKIIDSNGKVYDGVFLTAQELGIVPSGISQVLTGKRKKAGKLSFKYVEVCND